MNRRKIIKVIAVCASAALLAFFIHGIVHTSGRKKAIAETLQQIPDFEFYQSNSKPFTQDSLRSNTPVLFVYFHTDCDFCQHEIESIKNQLAEFKNMQLLFVSTESMEIITEFATQKELSDRPNIIFLQDKKLMFPMQFDTNTTPYTLLYDKDKKLINRFKGQVLAKTILKEWKSHEEQ